MYWLQSGLGEESFFCRVLNNVSLKACLDHIFEGKRASCLVNPRAGHEKDLQLNPGMTSMPLRY